jgi:hypothetical protein
LCLSTTLQITSTSRTHCEQYAHNLRQLTTGGPIVADAGWQCFAALVTVAVIAPEGSTYIQETRRGANGTVGVDVSLAVTENYAQAELAVARYPSVYQVRERKREKQRGGCCQREAR